MAIQGLSEYGGLYNSYRVNAIPQVDVNTVKRQEEKQNAEEGNLQNLQSNYAPSNASLEDNRSRIANLENISLTFHKEDTFDYIGSESEIGNLDVEKAVSDMKKDQVLQEYQYFVGTDASKLFQESEDGKVIQKQEF